MIRWHPYSKRRVGFSRNGPYPFHGSPFEGVGWHLQKVAWRLNFRCLGKVWHPKFSMGRLFFSGKGIIPEVERHVFC